MTISSKNVRKVKVEPIIRSSHKMITQLMTSNEKNIDDCKTHIKQYVNELNTIDTLIKSITNERKKNLFGYRNATM